MASLESAATLTRYFYYTVILCLFFQLPDSLFLGRSVGKSVKDRIKKSHKYLLWIHGLGCFLFMSLVEPKNFNQFVHKPLFESGGIVGGGVAATQILKYLALSLLALTLYDFGMVFNSILKDIAFWFFINCHHLGAFIALYFGPYGFGGHEYEANGVPESTNIDVSLALNAKLFGWLWVIHAFSFLLEVIFPLIGLKYKDDERSKFLDLIKHVYSVVTCYWFYQYFNADCQPGVNVKFWQNRSEHTPSYQSVAGSNLNYQTLALFVMLLGRFFVNANFRKVDFIRRIEFPGFWIIVFDNSMGYAADPSTMVTVQTHILDVILGPDSATNYFKIDFGFSYVAISLATTLLLGLLGYGVFFKKEIIKPDKYYGPEENEELKEFLDEVFEKKTRKDGEEPAEGTSVLHKLDTEGSSAWKSIVFDWFASQKDDTRENKCFEKLFPLHAAVIQGDAQLLNKLLLKGKGKAAATVAGKEEHSESNESPEKSSSDSESSQADELDISDAEDLSPNAICDPRHPTMKWSTPALMWTCGSQMEYSAECVYYLLIHGADPYLTGPEGTFDKDAVSTGIYETGGKLGNCKDFWQRLNAICCKKSPPEVKEKTLFERIKTVVGEW